MIYSNEGEIENNTLQKSLLSFVWIMAQCVQTGPVLWSGNDTFTVIMEYSKPPWTFKTNIMLPQVAIILF